MIERGINSPRTSSMGRLFDAAAAILGICGQATYEGEPAIELEAAAWHALDDEIAQVSPLQHRLLTLWLGGGGPDGKSAMKPQRMRRGRSGPDHLLVCRCFQLGSAAFRR